MEEENNYVEKFINLFKKDGNNSNDNGNAVAGIIKGFAWLEIIGGIILSIVMGSQIPTVDGKFNFLLCIIAMCVYIFMGVMIYGFGEIISKLHNIERKMK